MARDGDAAASQNNTFSDISRHRNVNHVWQVAANNEDIDKWIKYDPQFITPLQNLVKTKPFPRFQPTFYPHKKCTKRVHLPCASNGETCIACGKKCEPKDLVPGSFYDRRMHMVLYGVIKQ
jgi:hypothetical protein